MTNFGIGMGSVAELRAMDKLRDRQTIERTLERGDTPRFRRANLDSDVVP